MKAKLFFLLLFALALLIGCTSDDDNPTTPSTEQFGKNPQLLGFWKMVDEDLWQSKPLALGVNYCLYADENGFRQMNWKTSDSYDLIFESLDQEAAEQPIYYKYVLDGVGLQLYSESDTLIFERPLDEVTVTDSMEITYDIAAGLADLVLLNPDNVIEVLADDSPAGSHRFVWYPDTNLENGSYALDIQRTINDTIFTLCRKYIDLNR